MNESSEAATPRASDAILDRLLALHPKAIDLSLGRMTRLLDALGNPERAAPPVVHVAGTNGKGSVVAYLEAMLIGAGYRVNGYVSPHLVRFAERIRLDGRPIAEAPLLASLAHCEAVNDGAPITFFEITTAAAFHAFRHHPADLLLLEVGLGGRLDATNVIARPALSVITPVSIDHTHYLGETLALIAAEKAGILKHGVAGVIGRQEAEAAGAIERAAAAAGAPLARLGREWSFARSASHLEVRDAHGAGRYPLPALAGAHQVENAALAAVCARRLEQFAIGDAAIGRGLREARWPGRLQRIPWPGLAEAWGALGRRRPQPGGRARAGPDREGLGRPAPRFRRGNAEHPASRRFPAAARAVGAAPGRGACSRSGRECSARRHLHGRALPRHCRGDGRRCRRSGRTALGGRGAARPHPGVRLALSGRRRAGRRWRAGRLEGHSQRGHGPKITNMSVVKQEVTRNWVRLVISCLLAQTASRSHAVSLALGSAPTLVSATSPSLKRISVGMPRMP